MGLVTVYDDNFHRVAALQDDKRFYLLFDGKLGNLPGVQRLNVDSNVCHRIMTNRRVSLAIRPQLKDELERLTTGVIASVDEPTPRLSQVVVVKKTSGAL